MSLPESQQMPMPARPPDPELEPRPAPAGVRSLRRRRSFLSHGRPNWVPESAARFTYTYGLGGAAVLLFLTLLVTGVPLLFRYQPGAGAYESVSALTYVLPFGSLFRSLHFWAAQLLVLVALLHLLRVALTNAHRFPRRVNWLIGLGLLGLVIALTYSGYLLRGDLEGLSAAAVGRRLLQEVPLVGNALAALAFGSGGTEALLQLAAWHNLLLPLTGLLLTGWHLWRVRRDGGISHPASGDARHIPLAQLAEREWVAGLAWVNLLVLLALALPPGLGLAPGQPSPAQVDAPWVFGPVQALLRFLSPFTAGVALPLAALALLVAAPFLAERRPSLSRNIVLLVLAASAALTLYFWWG